MGMRFGPSIVAVHHQHLLSLASLMIAMLIVFLTCLSLMTHDVEYLFIRFSVVFAFSLVRYLFKSFAHCSIGLSAFFLTGPKIFQKS